jgi:methyl-accepting chemotaxis protein
MLAGKLKSLSIKQKMRVGFGVVLLILALIALQTVYSLLAIKHATRDVVENSQPTVITSMELAGDIKDALAGLGFYLLSKEESHKQEYLNHLKKADLLLAKLNQLPAIKDNAEASRLTASIGKRLANFKGYQDRMFALAGSQDLNFPAMSYSAQNINPLTQQVLQSINTMIRSEEDLSQQERRVPLLKLFNDMRYSWARLMSGIRAYLGFRTPSAITDIKNYDEYFNKMLDDLKSQYGASLSIDQESLLEDLEKLLPSFEKHLQYVMTIHGSDQWRQDAYLIRAEISPLLQGLNTDINKLIGLQISDIDRTSNSLITRATDTTIIVIAMLLLAMAAVATLSYLLTKGIIKPMTKAVDGGLQAIRQVMDTFSTERDSSADWTTLSSNDEVNNVAATFDMMAKTLGDAVNRQRQATDELRRKVDTILRVVKQAAEGDLTGHMMTFNGSDAIDELGGGVQRMIENLNSLATQVQQSGIQVTSSATEIAATARQQEATVAEQAASTQEIMATVTQISATSKELVKTMDEVAQVAENTASSAGDGQAALTRMEATMRQMREATDSITNKLAVLSDKAGNINNVVVTINKVADQTNLLSLNAAIEAEKAGEYGRGFAVVATEIRRLADQTAVATWDIEQMVKEMQSAVSSGVMGMDKFSEEVSRGVEEVRQVGAQLARIIDQVQTLTPRFESVNEGMQSQAQAAEQISDSMIQLNETAQQTAESLRQSNTSIQQLKDAAHGLQSGVSRFKVSQR